MQARQCHAQARDGIPQVVGGDVHAHEVRGPHQRAELARLVAIARPGLDHHTRRAYGLGNGVPVAPQQGTLGTRGVVLGQAGDGLEEFRAPLVIEILG